MTDPVIVVGGGVAGLAAAWQLHHDGMAVELIEAAPTVGGKVRSTPFAGRVVDEAADAFLARVPHGIELARELGLADRLITPATRRAQVWAGGLWPIPEPNVLGIPLEPGTARKMLGDEAAAAIDVDLARTEPDPVRDDDTIGSLVRRRLGDRVHEALVDPLLGAINAGDTDLLALAASAPQILAAAQSGPSLIAGLRLQTGARDRDAPVFHSFESGMQVLVDALAASLEGHITTGVAVQAVEPAPGPSLSVTLSTGERRATPAVVLACPAPIAAELATAWPDAATYLAMIPMVSVAVVALAYPAGTVDQPDDMSGFVVARDDPALRITACSYASTKWPHLGGELDVLRASVGHHRDQVTPSLGDDELIRVVRTDLETALGIGREPVAVRVSRWPDAFPQYTVGHLDRLAAIEARLNPAGVFLAGMSYRGIGIPANIDQGRTAAVDAILHVVEHRDG